MFVCVEILRGCVERSCCAVLRAAFKCAILWCCVWHSEHHVIIISSFWDRVSNRLENKTHLHAPKRGSVVCDLTQKLVSLSQHLLPVFRTTRLQVKCFAKVPDSGSLGPEETEDKPEKHVGNSCTIHCINHLRDVMHQNSRQQAMAIEDTQSMIVSSTLTSLVPPSSCNAPSSPCLISISSSS